MQCQWFSLGGREMSPGTSHFCKDRRHLWLGVYIITYPTWGYTRVKITEENVLKRHGMSGLVGPPHTHTRSLAAKNRKHKLLPPALFVNTCITEAVFIFNNQIWFIVIMIKVFSITVQLNSSWDIKYIFYCCFHSFSSMFLHFFLSLHPSIMSVDAKVS